jgi:hypothetical protein
MLFRRPLTLGLNQAASNQAGHVTPPVQRQAKSLLRGGVVHKVQGRLSWIHQVAGMNEMIRIRRGLIDPSIDPSKE